MLALSGAYRRASDRDTASRAWGWRLAAAAGVAGIVWGSAAFVLVGPDKSLTLGLISACLAGRATSEHRHARILPPGAARVHRADLRPAGAALCHARRLRQRGARRDVDRRARLRAAVRRSPVARRGRADSPALRERAAGRAAATPERARRAGARPRRRGESLEIAVLRGRESRPAPTAALAWIVRNSAAQQFGRPVEPGAGRPDPPVHRIARAAVRQPARHLEARCRTGRSEARDRAGRRSVRPRAQHVRRARAGQGTAHCRCAARR